MGSTAEITSETPKRALRVGDAASASTAGRRELIEITEPMAGKHDGHTALRARPGRESGPETGP